MHDMNASAGDVSAILLVAGIGRRLGDAVAGPKVLLSFGGQTLLERHLRALSRLGLEARVRLVENPDFRLGSLVSLSVQAEQLQSGRTVVLMDGDVLYDQAMITRLLAAPAENVLLLDREIEPGDEPVKICLRGERIVDLRKVPEHPHDWHGESVGFFRFSPATARALSERCAWYVAQGQTRVEYEEAIRDLILAGPGRFAATDISDIPWTEIDFVDDVSRAREIILPQLESRP